MGGGKKPDYLADAQSSFGVVRGDGFAGTLALSASTPGGKTRRYVPNSKVTSSRFFARNQLFHQVRSSLIFSIASFIPPAERVPILKAYKPEGSPPTQKF